jgi:hypothetical protein
MNTRNTLIAMDENNERPVPYARIVFQPSSIYRMRYKAEKRTTFLLAEDALNVSQSSSPLTGFNSPDNQPSTSKKNANFRKKTANEYQDGTFPKIEVLYILNL